MLNAYFCGLVLDLKHGLYARIDIIYEKSLSIAENVCNHNSDLVEPYRICYHQSLRRPQLTYLSES